MNKYKTSAVAVITVLVVLTLVQKSQTLGHFSMRVLADENKSGNSSDVSQEADKPEVTDKPEPTDTPEPKAVEQQVEKVHQDIQQQVDNKEVKNIEVAPSDASGSGASVSVENQSGQNQNRSVPSSANPVVTLQSTNSGSVSINVSQNGTITINNNGVIVQTQYPVEIDPVNKTLAIKTPSGITIINTLPTQALNGLPAQDKPTTIDSVKLQLQGTTPVYQTMGVQKRYLFGVIPVSANISSTVSAQDGTLLDSQTPWFFNSLGFLFTT